MIKVKFDLYNENEYVRTYEKEFKDEDESRIWFNSQMGHPYLCYSNIRTVDEDVGFTIIEIKDDDGNVVGKTRVALLAND